MPFLKAAQINETGRTINAKIAEADQAIARLKALKVDLVQISQTLAANTTDFTNADRAEFQSEMSRLTTAINGI